MRAERRTLHDVLTGHARDRSGSLAVREKEREWTYGDLRSTSVEITSALASAGLGHGARAALMLPNSGAFVASFFAIVGAGGVVAPFNPRYREQEIVYYLEDTRAAAIVVSPDAAELVEASVGRLTDPPAVMEVRPDGSCRQLRSKTTAAPPTVAGPPDAPLLHQYTSGSTGKPKRIVRTHGQLLYELEQLKLSFGLQERDRFLGAAPFSHVNGLVRSMMTSMYVGGTLYPMPEFRRRPILDVITRERLTYFGGVPYMYTLLAETPVRGHVDLSSLRVAFSASAPLLADDNRRFAEKYGVHVRQLYGSTETGTISVNLHPEVGTKLESVGTPLGGVNIEIRDDDANPVPAGSEGEVWIAGPGVIEQYDGNPEANATAFRDGFYLSGDLGDVDEDGYLTLTGRKKFLINRAGYKINPLEVEQAIQAHPKVREVVVLGAPSRFGDEIVRCVMVTAESCTAEEIVEFCRDRIADFKIPSRMEFREELPKSPTGKILRHEL